VLGDCLSIQRRVGLHINKETAGISRNGRGKVKAEVPENLCLNRGDKAWEYQATAWIKVRAEPGFEEMSGLHFFAGW
jgi:hypothetical protein